MIIRRKQGEIIENQSCEKQYSLFIKKFTIFHVTVKSYKYTEKIFRDPNSSIIQEYFKGTLNPIFLNLTINREKFCL